MKIDILVIPGYIDLRRVRFNRFSSWLLVVIASAIFWLLATGGQCIAGDAKSLVKTELLSSKSVLSPGTTVRLAVLLKPSSGWHIYYKEPGDTGKPTRVVWKAPAGFNIYSSIWQVPKRFAENGMHTLGYDSDAIIAVDVKVPKDAVLNREVSIGAKIDWLACGNSCIPGGDTLSIKLPVRSKSIDSSDYERLMAVSSQSALVNSLTVSDARNDTGEPPAAKAIGSTKLGQGLIYFLGLAFLGGMILNLMPCVLPVIAIKVVSLMEQAKDDPVQVKLHGTVFSIGIIAAFLSLALLVCVLKATGQSVGWGIQFQYPPFIVFMSVVVLLFSLSLFGLFYVNISAGQEKLDELSNKESLSGTFFRGILATTLSTPCTAPFLGTALGFAFSQSYLEIVSVFAASGLGMSSPYLLLCINPNWIKYLPRPGVWMEKFKESLGFILLGTLLWLLSVLNGQLGGEALFRTCTFLLFVAFSAWLVGRFTDLGSSRKRLSVVWTIAVAIAGVALYVCLIHDPSILSHSSVEEKSYTRTKPSANSIDWIPFTRSDLQKYLAEGKTVFVDFTADWCLTCKTNELTVLKDEKVVEKLRELGVISMKADWTNQNQEITELLSRFRRSGVPLYVIYPSRSPGQPIKLPDGIITSQQFLRSLQKAGPSIGLEESKAVGFD